MKKHNFRCNSRVAYISEAPKFTKRERKAIMNFKSEDTEDRYRMSSLCVKYQGVWRQP